MKTMEQSQQLQHDDIIKIIDELKKTTYKTEYEGLDRIKEWIISRGKEDWNADYISEIIQTEAEILDELNWKILRRVHRSTKQSN